MYFEKLGDENNPAIVFLHGAFFANTFGRQYSLADRYCLIVPHIMGYGNEAKRTFHTEEATMEIANFIKGLDRKVTLVGFSLGAQLAVKLVAEHEELFSGAVFVSPWLIKDEASLSKAYQENEKQLHSMKNRLTCGIIGFMNGLPAVQRKQFVEQMQNVSELTLKNTVYNGITLETIKGFSAVSVPTVALAGEKEQTEILDSISALQKMNRNCKIEIWNNAAHNIPPVFPKRFNKLICDFVEETENMEKYDE